MDIKTIVSESKEFNYLFLDDSFFEKETNFNTLEDFKKALEKSPNKDAFIKQNTAYDSFDEFNSAVIGLFVGKGVGKSIKTYINLKKKRT